MAWSRFVNTATARRNEDLDRANDTLASILLEMIDTNREILYELRLLNARFEEAFETQICCEDIEE